VVEQGNADKLLGTDGTHYTAAGNERLAEAVADSVLRQLLVWRDRQQKPAAPKGPTTEENRLKRGG
jgi:hypothetical protein